MQQRTQVSRPAVHRAAEPSGTFPGVGRTQMAGQCMDDQSGLQAARVRPLLPGWPRVASPVGPRLALRFGAAHAAARVAHEAVVGAAFHGDSIRPRLGGATLHLAGAKGSAPSPPPGAATPHSPDGVTALLLTANMHAREQQEQHEAAALPWGASNNPAELPPAPEPDLPVSHLNLQLGDRLEVLWELEEDGREPYTKASLAPQVIPRSSPRRGELHRHQDPAGLSLPLQQWLSSGGVPAAAGTAQPRCVSCSGGERCWIRDWKANEMGRGARSTWSSAWLQALLSDAARKVQLPSMSLLPAQLPQV